MIAAEPTPVQEGTDADWPTSGAIAVLDTAPADWDAHTVTAAGGHVYQSRVWAEHRRTMGWRPRYLVMPGSIGVLALTRTWPMLGGGSAYVPRGPIPEGDGSAQAERLAAVRAALPDVDVIAIDPEVPADSDFGMRIGTAGWRPIEEIQPSRHRLSLPLAGRDEDDVWSGVGKSTRQRIRKAEESELTVVRHDRHAAQGGGDGFAAPAESPTVAFDRFYDLLLETGERLRFGFGPRSDFVTWWTAAHEAGYLIYLEARDGAADGPVLAGLVLYRHGRRLSTVHSGDHAEGRRAHPGALHLLRWRAIQLALREGREEMDLGGADVAGARREPQPGDQMYGLYEHKRSFGATWLELTGAHELVTNAGRYAAGRALTRLQRLVGGRPA